MRPRFVLVPVVLIRSMAVATTHDPLLDAWFDVAGYEGSDECVGSYGDTLGLAPNGQAYNHGINGIFSFPQREWWNRDGAARHGARDALPVTIP